MYLHHTFSLFALRKVDSGKYRFGTSKTVRLIRMYGTSIVVRIGGGWENLYNVLLKLDPCREKLFGLSGLSKSKKAARSTSPAPPKNQHVAVNGTPSSKIPVASNRVAERRAMTDENGADIIMSHSENGPKDLGSADVQKSIDSLIGTPGARHKEKKMTDNSVNYPWNASSRTSTMSSSMSMENLDSCGVKFNPLQKLSKSMTASATSGIPTPSKQNKNTINGGASSGGGMSVSSSVDNINTCGQQQQVNKNEVRGKLGYTAFSEESLNKASSVMSSKNFLYAAGGNPKNMPPRRVSLVERQAQYAQKREEVQ